MCDLPKTKELLPFVEEVYSYDHYDTPNYNKLRHLLTVQLLNMNIAPQNSAVPIP